eukprot:CAMPEP_0172804574 /NCGR_PEP_ID=MMETSP1075-20121228/5264_1 /TAXON_ID=2916 /ORGANISM="Ceratium fusus, Strain PA161109" /LENGTH=168 /DNA_ID=CAMNT_0013643175 /DNA_START=81 /DNA_END=584 /DNA_ORIENTATION=+
MAASNFKACEAQPDLEKQPVFYQRKEQTTLVQKALDSQGHDEWDSTQYDISKITSWEAFLMTKGAAFDNPGTWKCMAYATLLSLCVAACTHFSIYALTITPANVQKLGTFLTVFVGFLLGFFLSSSTTRWFGCTNAFLQLLDAVRSMQMQMIALGVDHERCEMLTRYG